MYMHFFNCILTCKYVLIRLSPCATRRYSGYSLLHCPVGARWSEWKQGSGLEKTAFGYSTSRNPWKWYPPPQKNDLEVPRNGTLQKKPSVKKLVLVKWRKKGMKQNHRIHLHSISTSISLLETPAIFVVVLFRGPLLLSTKKHAAKSFGVWNPPQTDVWKTTFLKHHRFSWKFPRFPSFSFTGVSTEDENFLGFLPAVEIVQTFGTLLEPSHPATWCLERRKCGILVLLGKKGSLKPPPPKKNIGKNNWGTKKLKKRWGRFDDREW